VSFGKIEHRANFTARTFCYIEKLSEFIIGSSFESFGNIVAYRSSCSSYLITISEILIHSKVLVYFIYKDLCLLPRDDIFEFLYDHSFLLFYFVTLELFYSFDQELAHLIPEILTIQGIVDRSLQEAELVPCIIAVSLHLESVDSLPILYHTLEGVGEADLPILTSLLPIFF
jgi:hypothetical protein